TYTRPRVSLLYVLRRTLHRLLELQVWDVAAAMTFFGALSLLPTVVALLSVVSLLGVEEETVDAAAHLAAEIWPSLTPDVVREWILTLGSAGPGTGAVVLGAVGTVVSASGAVAAFHRAMHRIHDTREGRPF
ncbi:YhjD/YihY/BrkB family envelope integrity protein, partial [Enterobacter cloacae]